MTLEKHMIDSRLTVNERRMGPEEYHLSCHLPIQPAKGCIVVYAKPGMAEKMPFAIGAFGWEQYAWIAETGKIPSAFLDISIIE